MSSPVVAPERSGETARRKSARAGLLAVVAILSVVVLIDSELVAYGVPGIVAGSDMLHLPRMAAYVAIGVLGLLVLWLSGWLARQIWRVEHQLAAAQKMPSDMPAAC